jgi:hypothetical protein
MSGDRKRGSLVLASPWAVALALFSGSALLRLALATQIAFPPLGDAAYYIAVAQSLYAGRGFTVGSVWNYQPPPPAVVGPSNSYWGPLPSIVDWLGLLLFGNHLYAALLPGALLGAGLVALTYLLGRTVVREWLVAAGVSASTAEQHADWLALAAALLLAINAELNYQSVIGDSSMVYGAVGFAAIVLWERALRQDRVPQDAMAGAAEEEHAPRRARRTGTSRRGLEAREGGGENGSTAEDSGEKQGGLSYSRLRRLIALDRVWGWPGATTAAWAAGALLGGAYLTRGSFLFLALACIGWWGWRLWHQPRPTHPGERRRLAGAALALLLGAAVVTVPWLVRQQAVFGHMFSPEATHNALAFRIEEFYNYGTALSLATLLQHGVGANLALRATALWHELRDVDDVLFYPTALPAYAGLALLARRLPLVRFAGVNLLALLLGFAVVFPAVTLHGGYYHSVASIAPFLAWGYMAGVYAVARWARGRLPFRVSLAPALAAIPVLLQGAVLALATPVIGAGARHDAAVFAAVGHWLHGHHVRVVMTTEAATLNYASGIAAIELPAAQSPSVAFACARRYGAQYLVISETAGAYPRILRNHPDPHFLLVARTADYEVYQIEP